MPEATKTKLFLVPLTPGVFQVSNQLALQEGGSVESWNYLQATLHIPELCFSVVGDGVLYAVIYPETEDRYNKKVIQVHTVLAPNAYARRHDQVEMLQRWINVAFQQRYTKVVAKANVSCRLVNHILRKSGFTLEGVLRKECNGYEDVNYYGLLKEEHYGKQNT